MTRILTSAFVLTLGLMIGGTANGAPPGHGGHGGRGGHGGHGTRQTHSTTRAQHSTHAHHGHPRHYIHHPRYGYGYYFGGRYYRVFRRYVPGTGYVEVVEVVQDPEPYEVP
jgi:hypothetical protein